jgi:Domain of unknown function (DUF4153)
VKTVRDDSKALIVYVKGQRGQSMQAFNIPFTSKQAFVARLCVGAIFGLVIAALTQSTGNQATPKDPEIWREVLSVTLALSAFVIWAGVGPMRRISLAVWALIAAALIGYVIWFANAITMDRGTDWGVQTFLMLPLLFIAHELVSSADQAGQIIAPYETYFDEAWKRGVQLALAILFTLLFWGILWLGAALLGFIGFDWLTQLLTNEFFALPITGIAFGAAVHLGDVQPKLLANVRNLILGVLSWLLPVITLIGAIFAASLLASGLAPLWATKAATATLLSGCVGFVLLINAAYQQGDVERDVPMVLKWCVRGAAILLMIFAALAAWSLGLRIGQYGLSADRIFAGLGVIIAVAYGVSYSIAVFVPGRWMGAIEKFNIGLAAFMAVLFLAIMTPIATPDRLSVNDQIARLTSGKVSVEKFDWWLLKDETGKYGKAGLTKLSTSSNPAIAAKAQAALQNKIGDRPIQERGETSEPIATRAHIQAIQVVYPAGGQLPESFVATNFANDRDLGMLPGCLREPPSNGGLPSCKAALLDLNNDAKVEVFIREGPSLSVFTQIDGQWMGNTSYIDIGSFEADFDAGKLKTAPSVWNDIMIGEYRGKIQGFPPPPTKE